MQTPYLQTSDLMDMHNGIQLLDIKSIRCARMCKEIQKYFKYNKYRLIVGLNQIQNNHININI